MYHIVYKKLLYKIQQSFIVQAAQKACTNHIFSSLCLYLLSLQFLTASGTSSLMTSSSPSFNLTLSVSTWLQVPKYLSNSFAHIVAVSWTFEPGDHCFEFLGIPVLQVVTLAVNPANFFMQLVIFIFLPSFTCLLLFYSCFMLLFYSLQDIPIAQV